MPKISRLMNDQERAICARLRQFRRASEWSQPDLAYLVDSTRDQIASIESGRTPLRYRLGDEICFGLGISQRWLVEGKGQKEGYVRLGADIRKQIPGEILYGDAYFRFLKPRLDAHFEDTGTDLAQFRDAVLNMVGELDWEHAFNHAASYLKGLFENLPPDLTRNLYARIVKVSEEFTYEHQQRLKQLAERATTHKPPSRQKKSSKQALHDFSLKSKTLPVLMTLPGLLNRIRKATTEHGAKSSLARKLGVGPARITEWLRKNDPKEPGGEYTLAMLNWVQAWEARQKSPGDITTAARAKTRKRQSYERKTPSGP